VTVNALPTPSVNNDTSCNGATVTLTATGGVSYHWSTGAITASITTATAGTYTVTATNASGCTATASGTVTSSSPIITVNNPATCLAVPILLSLLVVVQVLLMYGAQVLPAILSLLLLLEFIMSLLQTH